MVTQNYCNSLAPRKSNGLKWVSKSEAEIARRKCLMFVFAQDTLDTFALVRPTWVN